MTSPSRPAGLTHAISFATADRASAVLLGLAIYSLLFCAWDLSHAHGARETILCDMAFLPMGLAVIGLVRRTSRMPGLDPATARAWRLLAWALFFDWTGTVLWLFADALFHVSSRLLSLIPSAAYYACLLASLVSFPFGPRTSSERRQFWLDVVIVSLGAAMLLWFAFHGAHAAPWPGDSLDALVAGIYAAGDAVMLLGIAVIVLGCPSPAAWPAFLSWRRASCSRCWGMCTTTR